MAARLKAGPPPQRRSASADAAVLELDPEDVEFLELEPDAVEVLEQKSTYQFPRSPGDAISQIEARRASPPPTLRGDPAGDPNAGNRNLAAVMSTISPFTAGVAAGDPSHAIERAKGMGRGLVNLVRSAVPRDPRQTQQRLTDVGMPPWLANVTTAVGANPMLAPGLETGLATAEQLQSAEDLPPGVRRNVRQASAFVPIAGHSIDTGLQPAASYAEGSAPTEDENKAAIGAVGELESLLAAPAIGKRGVQAGKAGLKKLSKVTGKARNRLATETAPDLVDTALAKGDRELINAAIDRGESPGRALMEEMPNLPRSRDAAAAVRKRMDDIHAEVQTQLQSDTRPVSGRRIARAILEPVLKDAAVAGEDGMASPNLDFARKRLRWIKDQYGTLDLTPAQMHEVQTRLYTRAKPYAQMSSAERAADAVRRAQARNLQSLMDEATGDPATGQPPVSAANRNYGDLVTAAEALEALNTKRKTGSVGVVDATGGGVGAVLGWAMGGPAGAALAAVPSMLATRAARGYLGSPQFAVRAGRALQPRGRTSAAPAATTETGPASEISGPPAVVRGPNVRRDTGAVAQALDQRLKVSDVQTPRQPRQLEMRDGDTKPVPVRPARTTDVARPSGVRATGVPGPPPPRQLGGPQQRSQLPAAPTRKQLPAAPYIDLPEGAGVLQLRPINQGEVGPFAPKPQRVTDAIGQHARELRAGAGSWRRTEVRAVDSSPIDDISSALSGAAVPPSGASSGAKGHNSQFVRGAASEWPPDDTSLDENDALFVKRTESDGKPSKYPHFDIEGFRKQLPVRFKNARTSTYGTPLNKQIPNNPGAAGFYGHQFDSRMKQKMDPDAPGYADEFNTILVRPDSNDSPGIWVHESGHAIWDKDVTREERIGWQRIHDAGVYRLRQAMQQAAPSMKVSDARKQAKVPLPIMFYQAQLGHTNDKYVMYGESFAELNSQFMLNPKAFKATYPVEYAYFQQLHGKEYIGQGKSKPKSPNRGAADAVSSPPPTGAAAVRPTTATAPPQRPVAARTQPPSAEYVRFVDRKQRRGEGRVVRRFVSREGPVVIVRDGSGKERLVMESGTQPLMSRKQKQPG